jgi:hypothetical protein
MKTAFFEGMRKPLMASQRLAEDHRDSVSKSYMRFIAYKFICTSCQGSQARNGEWLKTIGTP